MRNLKHEEELNRAHVKELADTRAKLEEYSDAVDVGEREKVVAEKERAIGDIEGPSTTAPNPPSRSPPRVRGRLFPVSQVLAQVCRV